MLQRAWFLTPKTELTLPPASSSGPRRYGTSLASVAAVSAQGKVAILDIDVQGAEQVRASCLGSHSLFLFVAPPSHEELERRLRGRGTETEEKVLKRLANAASEIEKSKVRAQRELKQGVPLLTGIGTSNVGHPRVQLAACSGLLSLPPRCSIGLCLPRSLWTPLPIDPGALQQDHCQQPT